MGWPWPFSSSPSPGPPSQGELAASSQSRGFGLTDQQRGRIFGEPRTKEDDSKAESRQEPVDDELDTFLKSFETTDAFDAAPAPTVDPTTGAIIPSPPQPYDRIRADGTLNIDPVALYPATMSCRQAFDQAFYCQSLGGKFNDVYRYGHVKDCGEQWGAFWFCMRTRTYPDHQKERAVREFYRLRDARRRKENRGNSEDVWELRTEAVQKAFWKDPDADEGGVMVKE